MNTRHLAVVMFTDIEGFTGLVQTDEVAAMAMRQRHREVFEAMHAKYRGTIIQYFGDGTLSTFKSSRDAVDCAIEMQAAFKQEPKVPLRIGIHLGDIISSADGIAGHAVNVAARVESLGVPGSIFVSAKIHDDIKNQKDVRTESMGFFEFKHVEKPKEVFAIANRGLVVPDPESLVGKAKLRGPRKEAASSPGGVLRDLWDRKVFLVAAAYLLGLWLLLKAAGYIVSTYALSPYWPDVLLVFFISFLPSVILHSYFHNRVELNRMRLVEKITIPSNAILSIALLVFLFGGKDLGAMTQTVTSTDEFGNTVEREVVKKEYLRKVAVYPFSYTGADSSLGWLEPLIPVLIYGDLSQSRFVWPEYNFGPTSLGAMSSHAASTNTPTFITGSIEKTDSLYRVTYRHYQTDNAKLIQEKTFEGKDLFALGDQITIQAKQDLGLPDYAINREKDLPAASVLTDQLQALRYFTLARREGFGNKRIRYYAKAAALDPSFAMNNLSYALQLHFYEISATEAKAVINQAMQHRSRGADWLNYDIRALYYKIHGQPEQAIALREMYTELEPNEPYAFETLAQDGYLLDKYEKAIEACEKVTELFPDLNSYDYRRAELLKFVNRPEEAVTLMEDYVQRYPKDVLGFMRLGESHLAMGNLDEAEKTFGKVTLMAPRATNVLMMLEHIEYMRQKGAAYEPEKLKPLSGMYRGVHGEQIVQIRYQDKRLYSRAQHQGAFQLYPVSDTSFVSGIFGIQQTFEQDGAGVVYRFKTFQGGLYFFFYALDSTIRQAEALLIAGQDEAALEAYKEAYEQHPSHHFLANVIKHLRFKRRTRDQDPARLWQDVLGTYEGSGIDEGAWTLEMKDGALEWGIPHGPKVRLLPLDTHSFAVLSEWGTKVSFHREPGKSPRLEWTQENRDTRSFEKVD